MIANEYRNVAMRYLSGLHAYLEWARGTDETHVAGSCWWISNFGPDRPGHLVEYPGYEGWTAANIGDLGLDAQALAKGMMFALGRESGRTFARKLYVRNMIEILRRELAAPCRA